jgi:fructose-bisphosphate aldolase class II
MPVATPAQYRAMIDAAQKGGYAYPAINVTSLTTINGALKAFAESKSDGIIQVSTGGGEFASGTSVKDMALGAIVLAEAATSSRSVNTTSSSPSTPTTAIPRTSRNSSSPSSPPPRRAARPAKATSSTPTCSTAPNCPLEENMKISKELLQQCAELDIILEIEAGVVGGEEDGHDTSASPTTSSTRLPKTWSTVYETLNGIGRFMFAATFGNVHGSYKPGAVKLKPTILKDGQAAVTAKYGAAAEMDLVFHGGSGTPLEEIRETLDYGVIKMNIDTDTQYAFTRPIVDHMMKNYAGVLKIDGEIGDKKAYDPALYLKKGEQGLCDRMKEACNDLLSTGKTIFGTVFFVASGTPTRRLI